MNAPALHGAVRRDYGAVTRVNPRKSVHIFLRDRGVTACGLSTATVRELGRVPGDAITCKPCRHAETDRVIATLARARKADALTETPTGPGQDLRDKGWRRDREVRATERRFDAGLLDELVDTLTDRAVRIRLFPRDDGTIADLTVCWCWEADDCALHCAATAELIRRARSVARSKRERAA